MPANSQPMPAKALTVHQPWAELIVRGAKRVENRTWATAYRGPLLVHAGLSRESYVEAAAVFGAFEREYGVPLPAEATLAFGALVGLARLVACVPFGKASDDPAVAALASPFAAGPVCWVLADPVRFARPVSCTGSQGLWAPDAATRRQLEELFQVVRRPVRVVDVRGLRGEARAGVVYVGRAFAGWAASKFGNHHRLGCPEPFRSHLLARPDLPALLAELRTLTRDGELPLGCWCATWDGVTRPVPACHAAVFADLLNTGFTLPTAPLFR
jgi:hypothetical protein